MEFLTMNPFETNYCNRINAAYSFTKHVIDLNKTTSSQVPQLTKATTISPNTTENENNNNLNLNSSSSCSSSSTSSRSPASASGFNIVKATKIVQIETNFANNSIESTLSTVSSSVPSTSIATAVSGGDKNNELETNPEKVKLLKHHRKQSKSSKQPKQHKLLYPDFTPTNHMTTTAVNAAAAASLCYRQLFANDISAQGLSPEQIRQQKHAFQQFVQLPLSPQQQQNLQRHHQHQHHHQQHNLQLQQHHLHHHYPYEQLHYQQQQNNSNDDNSLLWQPWRNLQHAAAMHHRLLYQQQLHEESRTKELPPGKWRRDRRIRSEYNTVAPLSNVGNNIANVNTLADSACDTVDPHNAPHAGIHPSLNQQRHQHDLTTRPAHVSMMLAAAASMRTISESTNRPVSLSAGNQDNLSLPTSLALDYVHHHQQQQENEMAMEAPLDMSVSSINMKQRSSPPPPYREPLPGSAYATTLARPSVITQAPPKQHIRESIAIANREHDNNSSDSQSMCETVIDEHFRRSLGPDYVALFGKKSPVPPTTTPSPQPQSYVLSFPMSLQQQHPRQLPHNDTVEQINAVSNSVASLNSSPKTSQPVAAPPAYHLLPQDLVTPKSSKLLIQQPQKPHSKAISSHVPQYLNSLLPPQEQPLALQRQCTTPEKTNKFVAVAADCSTSTQILQPPPKSPDTLSATSSSPKPTLPPALSPNTNTKKETSIETDTSLSPHSAPIILHHQHLHVGKRDASVLLSNSNSPVHTQPPHSPQSPHTTAIVSNDQKNGPNVPFSAAATINSTNTAARLKSNDVPSVDDHFAKALGDTWKKLQQEHKK